MRTQARQHAERVLQRKPDFVPVLNNLSLALAAEGQLDRAVGTAREALTHDPINYHALSNLTRFLCQVGQFEEARKPAGRLKGIDTTNADIAAKQAEALSYLGDDAGILAVSQRLDAAPDRDAVPTHTALVYHLAAVAMQRQGRAAEAQRLWERARRLGRAMRPGPSRSTTGSRGRRWTLWHRHSMLAGGAIRNRHRSSHSDGSYSTTGESKRWCRSCSTVATRSGASSRSAPPSPPRRLNCWSHYATLP